MAYVSIPTYWKSLPYRYRLVAGKCPSCQTINFPPEGSCNNCKKDVEFEEEELSGRGEIVGFSVISEGSAPPEFEEQQKKSGEFPTAVVELEEGPRITAQIVDCGQDDIHIGLKVEKVIRKIYEQEKIIRYGLKFRPVNDPEND